MNREERRKISKKAEKIWNLSKRIDTLGGLNTEAAVTAVKALTQYTNNLSFEELVLIDEYLVEKYGTST